MFGSLFNLLKTTSHNITFNISNVWSTLSSYTFLFKLRNIISVYITIYDYLQPKYYNILTKKKLFITSIFFLFKLIVIGIIILF